MWCAGNSRREDLVSTALPKKVLLGPFTYSVVRVPDRSMGDNSGSIEYGRQEIRVAASLKGEYARETLVHEMLHGLIHMAGLEKELGDSEEEVVKRLAPLLLLAVRDNPKAWWKRGQPTNG